MAKLSKRLVRNRDYFVRADAEIFDLSLEVLMALGARVDDQMARMTRYISSVEKALWRPNALEISDRQQRKTIDGFEVVHQALHSLVSHRFGADLRGRPQLTMLGEGIAGASEIYFVLQFVNAGGAVADCRPFENYAAASKLARIGFLRHFNRLLQNPFAAFQKNALDSAQVSNLFLGAVESNRETGRWNPQEFEKALKSVDHHLYLRNKDFGNFALFVANYCGFRSSKADQHARDACLEILGSSTSYLEFMMRMGAGEIIGGLRSKRAA